MNSRPGGASSGRFVALVFTLSAPFWILGTLWRVQLMPGLPVTGVMVACPLLAAVLLTYREQRAAGVAKLLARAVDFRRIPAVCYLPLLLLMPSRWRCCRTV